MISAGKGIAVVSEIPRVKKQEEGWVDTWGMLAGEEPDFRPRAVEGGDTKLRELNCRIGNIEAVFGLALRHRICWREERGQVMWLLKGSTVASKSTKRDVDDAISAEMGSTTGQNGSKLKRRERRRIREVDLILEKVLASV